MPQETTRTVLDSLSQSPILKGAVPTLGGVGMSFIEEIEIGLRLMGLLVGLGIGTVTLYIKIKDLKIRLEKERVKKK